MENGTGIWVNTKCIQKSFSIRSKLHQFNIVIQPERLYAAYCQVIRRIRVKKLRRKGKKGLIKLFIPKKNGNLWKREKVYIKNINTLRNNEKTEHYILQTSGSKSLHS